MRLRSWCLGMPIVLAFSGGVQGDNEARIVIRGEPGTTFTADWYLVPASGAAVIIEGVEDVVPKEFTLPVGYLELTVMQTSTIGYLDVVVSAGGNESRSRTQGQGSRLRLVIR